MKNSVKNILALRPPRDLASAPAELIDWFLWFAQLNLEKIENSHKFSMFQDYVGIFGPWIAEGKAYRSPTDGPIIGPQQIDAFLNDVVPQWSVAIRWLVDHKDESWRLLYQILHVTEWTSANSGGQFRTHHWLDFGEITDTVSLRKREPEVTPVLKVHAMKKGEDEAPEEISFPYGFHLFIESLDGYRTSNLRSCLHCNTIFFIRTRKLRNYCTPFCQKAAGMKRLRSRKKMESEERDK
ncbi:MAG: hypothetical protein H6Q63_725 [Firmicutes bacterium]|jgi:hypothetical protein|nr:hypothetical protein [Bacillota bacterium]